VPLFAQSDPIQQIQITLDEIGLPARNLFGETWTLNLHASQDCATCAIVRFLKKSGRVTVRPCHRVCLTELLAKDRLNYSVVSVRGTMVYARALYQSYKVRVREVPSSNLGTPTVVHMVSLKG
jgi:hypothetical protein